MAKDIIVFAPHPDDETLGCGGTIAKKISEGYNVSIVFLTDGRNAYLEDFGITSEPTPYELQEIRKEEAKRVANILGVKEENLFFLGIEDGMLERNEEVAQVHIINILSKTSPIEVYLPYEKDLHIDHRLTNRIVRNSIAKLNLHPIEYQYTIWRAQDAAAYTRIKLLKETIFNLLKHDLVYVSFPNFLPLKKMAIAEYKSQIAILFDWQKRPVLESWFVKRFLKSKEKFFVKR